MGHLPVLIVASLVACLGAVVPAFAQMGSGGGQPQAPQAPPSGIDDRELRAWLSNGYGGVGQTLTGNIAINGGTFRRLGFGIDGMETATDSAIASLSGGLFYAVDGGRAGITASYQGFASRYGDLTEDTLYGHAAKIAGNVSLSARTTLSASQGVYYEPPVARSLETIFNPGGGVILPGLDVGAIEDRALSYISSADLRHQISTRTDLSVGYRHWVFDMRGEEAESPASDQVTDDAFAQLTHNLGAGFSLRLGYRYAVSRVDVATETARTERNAIDAGLDFSRALSLSRSTTLAFSTGTVYAIEQDDDRLLFTGRAELDQEMGRSWSARVFISRQADFVEGITGIVVSDQAGASLQGEVSRRIGVEAGADVTRGDVGLESTNSFDGLRGFVATSVGLSRYTGLSIQYSYYETDFASTAGLLSPGLQKYFTHTTSASVGWKYLQFGVSYTLYEYQLNRDRSLTARVSLFAPLVARTRRPDASR